MADNHIITALNPADVLFGRGSGPNDHEGNIKFRDMVSAHKTEYMATNHRQTKAKIARSIVDTVLAKNGRFLKKAEPADLRGRILPNGMDAYVAVSDETVMEKAKQALRQNREKRDDLPPAAAFSGAASASTPTPDLAYGDLDVQQPDPAPSLAHHAPLAAYQIPEMPSSDKYEEGEGPSLDKYEEGEAQFATFPTQRVDPDEDTRGLRQPDMAYGEYDVQNSEPARSLPQQPPSTAYIGEEQFATYTTQLADPAEDEEQFATYTTQLADPEEDEEQFATYTTELADLDEDTRNPRRTNVMRTMDYGNGAGGSRRGSLLGGRRDSMQARRDSAGSRRESLTMAEIWRRDSMIGSKGESMDMSDLMNSFKGMSAGDLTSSSDTIGTIDHMEASGLSKMSIMSMQSATSLFRTDSNDDGDTAEDPSRENQTGPLRGRSGSNDMMGSNDLNWGSTAEINSTGDANDRSLGLMNPPAQMNTRASITPGQLTSLMTGPIGSMSSSGSQFMNSGEISGFGGSSKSGFVTGMSTKSLFDMNKSPTGKSAQILPPKRK